MSEFCFRRRGALVQRDGHSVHVSDASSPFGLPESLIDIVQQLVQLLSLANVGNKCKGGFSPIERPPTDTDFTRRHTQNPAERNAEPILQVSDGRPK